MEEDKAKLVKACHRARIQVLSVRDSLTEIQNKIQSDPEAFDTHVLHDAIKELSSSQEGLESLGYSQISDIFSSVPKPNILNIDSYDGQQLLDLVQEVLIFTSSVSSGLEKMVNDLKCVETNASESKPESDPPGISGEKLMNRSVDGSSNPSAQAESTPVDDAHDTEEEKDERRPSGSETVAYDKSGSANSQSKASPSGKVSDPKPALVSCKIETRRAEGTREVVRSTVLHLREQEPVRFKTVLQLNREELMDMLKQCQISEHIKTLVQGLMHSASRSQRWY